MALFEKHLYVKKSTLPNAGKGLFTKVAIPKGEKIVEYKGRITTWKEVKDDDGKNGYIFYVNRNHVIDAWRTERHLARYANDARGLSRMPGIRNNCDYITTGLKAYIESNKNIPANSEIFVDYGPDYWKTIRDNIKLEKQEAKTKKKTESRKKRKKTAKRVDTHLLHQS
jgi:SET domain-containing protein